MYILLYDPSVCVHVRSSDRVALGFINKISVQYMFRSIPTTGISITTIEGRAAFHSIGPPSGEAPTGEVHVAERPSLHGELRGQRQGPFDQHIHFLHRGERQRRNYVKLQR